MSHQEKKENDKRMKKRIGRNWNMADKSYTRRGLGGGGGGGGGGWGGGGGVAWEKGKLVLVWEKEEGWDRMT